MKRNPAWEMIGARLREERERIGRTQTEFASMGSASKRSQTDWEQGNLVPNGDFLAQIATHGIDVGYILTGERNGALLSYEEQQFLAELRNLDERGKDCVLGVLAAMGHSSEPGAGGRDFLREVRLLTRFRGLNTEMKDAVEIAANVFGPDSTPPSELP